MERLKKVKIFSWKETFKVGNIEKEKEEGKEVEREVKDKRGKEKDKNKKLREREKRGQQRERKVENEKGGR